MRKLPTRLERDPILEAVFELRFTTKTPAAGDALFGTLFTPFKDRFPTITRLPVLDLIPNVTGLPPELAYQPRVQLDGKQFSLFVGDRSVVLNCHRPYAGWRAFRPLILELLQHIEAAGVVGQVERYSLKYVNVLLGFP